MPLKVDWYWLIVSAAGGGLVFKLIDYLIAWARERREQKAAKTAHEKDRPRFRVDVAVTKPGHPLRPTVVVRILSLGGLPVTVNQGHVIIESSQYPDCIQPHELHGLVISQIAPIEIEFPFTIDILHSLRGVEFTVKVVCKFSYDGDQEYSCEKAFNRKTDHFEDI